jgi:dihydroorotate dehydrogenase electron transfer subunit
LRVAVVSHTRISDPDAAQEIFLLRLYAPEIVAKVRPGQFVMLKVAAGLDPLLTRPFSVHGARGGSLLLLYRVVGKGTRLLSQVEEGMELLLWGPLGRGFELDAERPVLVAGGMGVAPLVFAAERLAARLAVQGRQVRFLCGLASAGQSRALLGRLGCLPGAEALRVETATADGSKGVKGLVTALLPAALAWGDAVLACGPSPMLKAVAKMCAEWDKPCQVSLESPMACGVGACLGCAIPAAGGGYLRTCQEGPVMYAVQVDWERL